MKQKEEVFNHNDRFLAIFNLDNHNTIFQELINKAEIRKIEEENKITENFIKIFERL